LETGDAFVFNVSRNWLVNGHVSGIASVNRGGRFYFSNGDAGDGTATDNAIFVLRAVPTKKPASFDRGGVVYNYPVFASGDDRLEWWGGSGAVHPSTYVTESQTTVSADGTKVITAHKHPGTGLRSYVLEVN